MGSEAFEERKVVIQDVEDAIVGANGLGRNSSFSNSLGGVVDMAHDEAFGYRHRTGVVFAKDLVGVARKARVLEQRFLVFLLAVCLPIIIFVLFSSIILPCPRRYALVRHFIAHDVC